MKQLFIIFITTLLILSACGKVEKEVNEEMTDLTEDSIIEDVDLEEDMESELDLPQGFLPFEEINDFVIDETWSEGNIRHILKAEDGTLYYFSDFNGDKETGFIYEVFTIDENNNAIVESKIYSPTNNRLIEEGESFEVNKQIIDNMLVIRYEHHEDYNNFTMQVTVETLNISDIFTGEIAGEYESEVVMNKTIENIEDVQFNDIVSTSKGPVFVYQEDLESGSELLINSLNNNEIDEELVLNDPYGLAFDSDIKFINFEQGYYFLYDYGEDGLKRLEIESGEPLYEGADDKVLPLDRDAFDRIIPINGTSFYAIDDYNYAIYVINTDLDLIDSTSLFASEYEADEYDGYINGPYYLGNNEFLIIDEYEYQRDERMKLSVAEYVF